MVVRLGDGVLKLRGPDSRPRIAVGQVCQRDVRHRNDGHPLGWGNSTLAQRHPTSRHRRLLSYRSAACGLLFVRTGSAPLCSRSIVCSGGSTNR
jgi:hypothetical protein